MGKKKDTHRGKARGPGHVAFFKRYLNEGRHAKNQLKKLKKHLVKFPDDKQAEKALHSPIVYKRNVSGRSKVNKEPKNRLFALLLFRHTKKYPEQRKFKPIYVPPHGQSMGDQIRCQLANMY